MLWILAAVILLAAVAAWWKLGGRGLPGLQDLEKEIAGFGLEPRYDELRKEYEAGRIPFERMMLLRQVELQACRILRELGSKEIPEGQAAVLQPQTDLDRQAFDLLAQRGRLKPLDDGEFAWIPPPKT